jgi:hypothetical protein
LEQAKQDAAADSDPQQASTVNAIDTWKFLYDQFEDLLVDRLQRNPEIVSWALSDHERLKMIRDLYAAEVYDACRKAAGAHRCIPCAPKDDLSLGNLRRIRATHMNPAKHTNSPSSK